MNIDPDIDHTTNPLTQGNIFDVNARRPVNQNTPFDERLKISEMLGNKEAEELQAEELQAKIKNVQRIKTEKMREKLHNPNKEARIKKIKQIRAQTAQKAQKAQKAQTEKDKFFYEPNTEIASTIQYMAENHNATGVWCVLHPTLLQYSIIGTFIETITVRVLKDYDTVGVPQKILKFMYNDKTRLFTEEEINKLPIEYKEETEETEETEEITKFGEIYTHMQQMEYGEWNTKNDLSIESYFFEVSSANYTIVNNCIAIQNAIIQYNAGSEANMPQSRQAWLKGLYNNLYDNVMLFQRKYPHKQIPELITLAETMKEEIKDFLLNNGLITDREFDEYNRQFDSNFDGRYGNMFKEFRDSYIKYYGTHEAVTASTKKLNGSGISGHINLMQRDFNNHMAKNRKNDYKYMERWISEGDAAAAGPSEAAAAPAAPTNIGVFGNWASTGADYGANAASVFGNTLRNFTVAKGNMPVGQQAPGAIFSRSGGKRKSKRKQRRSRKQKKSRKQRR